MWNNFKYRCQNLFSHEGGSRSENVDMNANRCLSVKEKSVSLGEAAPRQQSSPLRENIALQLGLSPSKTFSRRNQNCAAEIPQVVEISIEKDSDSSATPGTRLARRDSYSRHAPWGGKKKHSCSTKTQSSLDTEKSSVELAAAFRGGSGAMESAPCTTWTVYPAARSGAAL